MLGIQPVTLVIEKEVREGKLGEGREEGRGSQGREEGRGS